MSDSPSGTGLAAKVLTVSDGVVHGTREDRSGAALVERLTTEGYSVVDHRVVEDGAKPVAAALTELAHGFAGVIVSTGGTGFTPRDLTPEGTKAVVERARMLQRCFDTVGHEVDAWFATDGRCAFSFRLFGRQVGPLATPLGEVAPTGRRLEAHGMDIFEIADGRVRGIWAILDWLDLLTQAGAVAVRDGG